MPKRTFNPPLRKRHVQTVEPYEVYTVSAFAIRNAAQPDEEFDNVAIPPDFPDLIKDGEIWTAESTFRREGQFFIANAVAELDALAAGKSKSDAYDAGIRAERKRRAKVTGLKFRNGRPHRRVPESIYRRRYAVIPDKEGPITVWLVDGCLVRCYYKTDYTEGGHGEVYRWVPKGEIWVESNIDADELPYIVAHEYTELRLMRECGYEYDRAHAICAEMEFDLRKADERRRFPGFSRERMRREDLATLVMGEFFGYVRQHYTRGFLRRVRSVASDISSKLA